MGVHSLLHTIKEIQHQIKARFTLGKYKKCYSTELQLFFLAAPRGLQDLSSPTWDQTCGPLQWKHRALTTRLPGKSHNLLTHMLVSCVLQCHCNFFNNKECI